MTITYTALTSTTKATAALANSDLMDKIKTMVTAHPAWTAVDDTVVGTGSNRWLCFKNAAATSGLPNDYFVLFVWNAGSAINCYVGETYNAGTHTLTWPCGGTSSNSTAQTADSVGHANATTATVFPLATGAVSTTGVVNTIVYGAATTTIFYMCLLYDDHLIFGSGSTATMSSQAYLGGFTSLLASPSTNDPFPIVLMLNSNAGVYSRTMPAFFSIPRFSYNSCGGGWWNPSSGGGLETGRSASTLYDYGQAMYPLSRVLAITQEWTASGVNGINTRGRLSNMLYCQALPTGMVAGDTISYNGTSWVGLTTGSGGMCVVDTGAP